MSTKDKSGKESSDITTSSTGSIENISEQPSLSEYLQEEMIHFTKEQEFGYRIKKFMYKAKIDCFIRGVPFPYETFLQKYCLPGSEEMLKDDSYYLVKSYEDAEVIEKKGRYIPNEEKFLRELKNKIPGSYIRYNGKEPFLFTKDGLQLRCSQVSEEKEYSNSFQDLSGYQNTSVFPRIVNIDDEETFWIETSPSKYTIVTKDAKYQISDSIKEVIDRVYIRKQIAQSKTDKEKK